MLAALFGLLTIDVSVLHQQLLDDGLPHRLVTFGVSCDFRPSPLTSLLDLQNWERANNGKSTAIRFVSKLFSEQRRHSSQHP